MERLKKVARIIDPEHWPDSATEDLLYWIKRPPEERVEAGRELLLSSYGRIYGLPLPRMTKVGRVFEPEP